MSAAGRAAPLSDQPARERAATLFGANLVVVAGAGTGKTSLLVERALNLIAGAGVPITGLAAITFTEKAAAELRERLAGGLDELRSLARRGAAAEADARREAGRAYLWLRRSGEVTAQVLERRALQALLDLDQAPVCTLHAFCADILRRHPREAGVDPSFLVDEGPIFETLFAGEWEAFLARELGPGAPRADVWRRALRVEGALDAIRTLAAELSSFRLPDEALAPGPYRGGPPRALLGAAIESALAGVAAVRGRARGMNPNMEILLDQTVRYLRAVLDGGAEALVRARGEWTLEDYLKKTPAPGRGLQGCTETEAREAAARAQELVGALARVDEETIAALVDAAAPLARQARDRLLASGYLSFDALLRLARNLLARETAIRRELGARHRAILVDEFQDTDPLQYEILFFLAEEDGAPAEDAYEARLAPGRLFIVGDPKQSIYRFRGADIEAYRRAVERVEACGGEVLTLDNSFRSPEEIVRPINRLFAAWIGDTGAAEQPEYLPIVSARGRAEETAPRLEIWSVAAAGDVETRRQAEARAVAGWIAENRGRSDATGGPLLCRQIAILFRALTSVALYAEALRTAGIPFVVEGGKNFYQKAEVADLLSFLRACANPNDGPALLAVLRGPLGGVPDAELAALAADGGRLASLEPGEVDGDRFPGVRRALQDVERFRSRMPGRSPDEVIRAALRETPLPILHASLFDGAQRVANLRKIAARAEDLARGGLSLEETLWAIEEEFGAEREEGESPLADETVEAVRIFSVHKAKGLEFPVVIVPDVGRGARRGGPPRTAVAWVREGAAGFLGVGLGGGPANLAWVRHARDARRHDEAEEKRVFYVACTRARERLILVNSNPEGGAPWRDALSSLGYGVDGALPPDGILCDGLVRHRRIANPRQPEVETGGTPDGRWREAALRFADAAAAAARATAPLRSPAAADREEPPDAAGLDEAAPPRPRKDSGTSAEAARLAGSAVHRALEGWDFRDGGRLRERAEQATECVLAEEHGGRAPAALARRVRAETGRILDGFLGSPLPSLLASVPVLGREVPVLYKDDHGATWSGACDLLYRDPRGRLVVADYKTERVEGDPAAAAARHGRQMEIYLAGVRRALPEESVRGEIIFVRAGISVPL